MMAEMAQAATVFGIALAISLVARHLLLRSLAGISAEPDSAARALFETLRLPSLLWCLLIPLVIAIDLTDLRGKAPRHVSASIVVLLVVSVCAVASSLLVRLVMSSAHQRGLTFVRSGVMRALIHVFVWTLGASVLLRHFDIAVAPLLTALGVGGLALALALQDTLANFFAGIHILVEAPISVGDFIRLSSGEEGTVTDIGWRTTRVETTANNTVVIPNHKITSSILTNFMLPDARVAVEVILMTSLDSDVEKASQIALEEAGKAETVLKQFPPLVLFDPGVTPTHLQFKLIVQAGHRLHQGPLQSELRLRILERFRREGIPLPVPEVARLLRD
jgi:small-conductance mechanosensitive channel